MPKKQTKHAGGRPTKYKGEETLKLAEEYIQECKDEFEEVVESINEKTGRERFKQRLIVKLPKAEGLALRLGVSRKILYDWAEKYPKFRDILERINSIQADRVINMALAGNYNPLIAKLLLGKHGYSEKQEVEHSGKDGSPLAILLKEISNEKEDLAKHNES